MMILLIISNGTPLFENDFNTKKHQKTLKSNLENFLHFVGPKILAHPIYNVKLTSAVKTLISGATSRYTTFTLIVAQRYHQNFAGAAQLLIKP
jgi:hypothetical protein